MLFTFKDVEAQYKTDKGTLHPWYLDQLLWSKALRLIGGILTVAFGITLSQSSMDSLTGMLPVGISAAITIYGEVMNIVTQIKSKSKQNTINTQVVANTAQINEAKPQ
jgi:hypothetical protein